MRERVAFFDGVRALSIAMVLFGHAMGTAHAPAATHFPKWFDLPALGVRTFFVLSGLLITTRLLDERRRSGRISLGRFYLRRAFRIMPASIVFVTAIAALAASGAIALRSGDLFHALTYTVNYHPSHARAWWLGHLWSLSVEEQFYLLWPPAMLWLSLRGSQTTALIAAAVAPILRALLLLAPAHAEALGEAFPLVCDSIAIGCAMAHLGPRLATHPRYIGFLRSRAFVLVPVLAVLAIRVPYASFHEVVLPTLQSIAIALVLDRCLRMPQSRASRWLAWTPLVWLGTISYSLYLWQQPFLDRYADGWWTAFPLNLALAVAIATLSYLAIERPFLALGRRALDASHVQEGAPA